MEADVIMADALVGLLHANTRDIILNLLVTFIAQGIVVIMAVAHLVQVLGGAVAVIAEIVLLQVALIIVFRQLLVGNGITILILLAQAVDGVQIAIIK